GGSGCECGEVVIVKSHEASRDRVLSHEEEGRLLAACTGSRAYLRAILIMAVDTAMRRGEILKLTWAMVNLAQGIISLPGEITKTGKPRAIPITYRLQAKLKALRAAEKSATTLALFPTADSLVFGGAVDLKYAWQCACKEARISGLRFHDLRHSAVTRMIAAGVNPA